MRIVLAGMLILLTASFGLSVYLGFRLAAAGEKAAGLNATLAKVTRTAQEHAVAELEGRRALVRVREQLTEREEELARARALRLIASAGLSPAGPEGRPRYEVESSLAETVSDVWFCSRAILRQEGVVRGEDTAARTLKGTVGAVEVWVEVEEIKKGETRLRVACGSLESARGIRRQIEQLLAENF